MKRFVSCLCLLATLLLSANVIAQTANLDQARKEGEVILYSTITVGAFNKIEQGCQREIFLNVRHIRLGPAQQLARIMQEQRAGQFLADVVYNNLFT